MCTERVCTGEECESVHWGRVCTERCALGKSVRVCTRECVLRGCALGKSVRVCTRVCTERVCTGEECKSVHWGRAVRAACKHSWSCFGQ